MQTILNRTPASVHKLSLPLLNERHISDLVLGDVSPAQLELLLGTLQFMGKDEGRWITWVNPPSWSKDELHARAQQMPQLRTLHEDKGHTAFYLLYVAMQAGNSNWVIGNSCEISLRQRDILALAAQQHGCRLLMLSQRIPRCH